MPPPTTSIAKPEFKITMFDTYGEPTQDVEEEEKLRLPNQEENIVTQQTQAPSIIDIIYQDDDEVSPDRLTVLKREDALSKEVTNFASLYKLKGLLGIGAFGVVLLV